MFRNGTLRKIADMICGDTPTYFVYRTGTLLQEFMEDCGFDETFGGTRRWWVVDRLREALNDPKPGAHALPARFTTIIQHLMNPSECKDEDRSRANALLALNAALRDEGFEAFYADDGNCYVRHVKTNTLSVSPNLKRPLSKEERETRNLLDTYLNTCSEDDLTTKVLLPLLRQLGFERITVAGHRDKAMEFGKDLWMKFTLPTQHSVYFGVQVKKGKVDAAGATKGSNANAMELVNQARMALGHPVFDPAINKNVLVDHVYIVAGGEITKQARHLIVTTLDQESRRHIIFMDRDDLLELFPISGTPLPSEAKPKDASPWDQIDDDVPF